MPSHSAARSRLERPFLALIAFCAASAAALAAAPSYTVTELDLQTIPLTPRCINTGGDIVGSFIVNLGGGNIATRGFVRPHNGKATQSPLLGGNPGEAVNCLARGINDQGVYVGSCEKTVGGPEQAFMQDQFSLADVGSRLGTAASRANAISNANSGVLFTIVGAMGPDLFTGGHAFAWIRPQNDPVGTVLDFGPGEAYGVNDAGDVVGELRSQEGFTTPFVFHDANGNDAVDDGEVKTLNTLGGSVNNAAYSINQAGAIVGQSSDPGKNGTAHPVRWDNDAASPVILGGQSSVGGVAFDINQNGQIVGLIGGEGFYFSDGELFKLSQTVPSSAHYQVMEALSLNNDAAIVANGNDTATNKEIGSLLTPGVPQTSRIKSFTLNREKARPGDKIKAKIVLKGTAIGQIHIPLTVSKDGVIVPLPFTPEVIIEDGENTARKEFDLPNIPKGTYTITANYGPRPKSVTLKVQKAMEAGG